MAGITIQLYIIVVLKHNSSEQLVSLWDEYDKIQVIIQRLQDLQGKDTIVPSRMDKIPTFEKWLRDHGAVYTSVSAIVRSPCILCKCILSDPLVSVRMWPAIFCMQLDIVESPGTGLGLRCTTELKVTTLVT